MPKTTSRYEIYRKHWYKSWVDLQPGGAGCSAARALRCRPLGYPNTYPHTNFGRAAVTWTASWTVHALRFRVGRGQGLPAGGCLRAEQGLARRRRTLPTGSGRGRRGLPPGAASRPARGCLRRRQPPPLHMAGEAAAAATKTKKDLAQEAAMRPKRRRLARPRLPLPAALRRIGPGGRQLDWVGQ